MTEFTDEGSLVVFTDSSSDGDSLFKKSIRKVYSFSSNSDSIITSLLDIKRLREMLLDDHINILSSDVPLNHIIFYKEHKPLPLL